MDIIERAIRAYKKRCEREGRIYDQPDSSISGLEKREEKICILLRNVNGILAVYQIRKDGRLRWNGVWLSAFRKAESEEELYEKIIEGKG